MSPDMKGDCCKAFELWANERGNRIDRFDNDSGYIEFKDANTMRLWHGWYAAWLFYTDQGHRNQTPS